MKTEELLALVGKATPGPWSVYTPEHSPSLPGIDAADATIVVWGDALADDGGVRGPANAALIVAAVNALPSLLDALDRAERERDEARASSEAWRTRFRGVAGALRAFLAAQPQTEKVRETIEGLDRDLGWDQFSALDQKAEEAVNAMGAYIAHRVQLGDLKATQLEVDEE